MNQYEVKILETGETVLCSPGQSVLDGIVKLGSKGIPMGCRGGGCGVCKVQICSGSYARKPMSRAHVTSQDELAGQGLACRLIPTSNISLHVLGVMGRAVSRAHLAG